MKLFIYLWIGVFLTVLIGAVAHALGLTGYWLGLLVGTVGCASGNLAATLAKD